MSLLEAASQIKCRKFMAWLPLSDILLWARPSAEWRSDRRQIRHSVRARAHACVCVCAGSEVQENRWLFIDTSASIWLSVVNYTESIFHNFRHPVLDTQHKRHCKTSMNYKPVYIWTNLWCRKVLIYQVDLAISVVYVIDNYIKVFQKNPLVVIPIFK